MSNSILQNLLFCTIILCLPTVSFAQVMEWPDEMEIFDGDMDLHTLYMMGGEYRKALPELEQQLDEVALKQGKTSLRYLNLQYHQWFCYHFTQQEAQARQIRQQMNAAAVQLAEDSLMRHLLYKRRLDAQLYTTLLSGASMAESLSESDDPIVRALGSASILDPQEMSRKIAAGMEISQKYEGDEEAMQEEMMMEMFGEMFGQKGAEDLAEMMQFAEEGAGIDNQEALDKLLEMEDNILISSYVPLLRQLQGVDENSSLDVIKSVLAAESIPEGKWINDLMQETTGADEEGQDGYGTLDKMFDEEHIINSTNIPFFQQLEGEDKSVIASILAAEMKGEMAAEAQATANAIERMGRPLGYDATPTISSSEFEEKMQRFDQLSREEKAAIEGRLHQKLGQRDQLEGKIRLTSHGDIYLQLARFYEADGQFLQAADFYQSYKEAAVEYWLLLQEELKPTMMDMTEEEDQESEAFRYFTGLDKQVFLTSSLLYSLTMRHHQKAPGLGSYAYNTALRDKAYVLERQRNLRSSALASDDTYLRKVAGRWLNYRKEHAEQLQLGQEDFVTLQRIDLLERELSRHAGDLLQTDWKAVQQQLKPGEAAIEFVYFNGVLDNVLQDEKAAASWKDLEQHRNYAAVVLRPEDHHPHFIPLAAHHQLDSIVAEYITSLVPQETSTRGATPLGATPVGTDMAGKEVYEILWAPLEPMLEDVQTVYFAPAGSLHRLPFAALPYQEGVLLDRYALHQLSSTRQIGRYKAEPLPRSAALFGGIDFFAEQTESPAGMQQRDFSGNASLFYKINDATQQWGLLTQTKTEVESIARLLQEQQLPYQLYMNGKAQESTLSLMASPGILHIATHGFFLPDPAGSATGQAMHSLQRSGLMMAGSLHNLRNSRQTGGSYDGILLASEAAQLDLQQTHLVVLSACKTGRGEVRNSEGVYGLQRALREAGARYLIMSLWDVPDKQTLQMMEYFYIYWLNNKLPIREAFRRAQQEMRQQYLPAAWAGFVLVE
jgi:CHAT domain-containing protein